MAKKTVEKKHSTTDQDVDDPIKNCLLYTSDAADD